MRFVLVHGSWHNGATWGRVRKILEADGHEVHTPTIGGFEPGCDKQKFQTLDAATEPVLQYILDRDLRDFALLAHSFGGMVVMQVAMKLAGTGRINRLIYQNAFIPLDGQSTLEMCTGDALINPSAPINRVIKDDLVYMPLEPWKAMFINHGDEALAKETLAYLSAQPIGQYMTKVSAPDFAELDVPKTAIMADEDKAMDEVKGGWYGLLPRLGKYKLIEIKGDHEIMFTNPQLLADSIVRAGKGEGKQMP